MISEVNVEAAVETASTPRHIALVRITHWIVVLTVLGLLITGTGILVSHPRLYWGETGGVGTPSLIDLPIPFIIGPSVWNRPFHFFFAWVLVLTGLTYMVGSFITQHFRKDLLPAKADLRWNRIIAVVSEHLRWRRPEDDDNWIICRNERRLDDQISQTAPIYHRRIGNGGERLWTWHCRLLRRPLRFDPTGSHGHCRDRRNAYLCDSTSPDVGALIGSRI